LPVLEQKAAVVTTGWMLIAGKLDEIKAVTEG